DNPDVLRPLGQILLKLGREPEGLEILEKVLALKPDDVETMQALADHYARQERWEEAEKWARKLQDKMPDNPDVLRPLGQILLKLGREPEGLEILEKVLALKPDDVETMQTIYAHYNNRRHYSEAERWARKALEYRPRDPKLQQHLALILCQQDDYEEALALLDQALANGDNPLANRWAYWLGMPAVMMSREDIANWRNRFQQGMEVLMGMEGHLNWWESKPGNFFLAYHDESDRLLLEALSCLVRAKVPSVNYTAPHIAQWQMPTQRRIRVGFCSAHFRMHTISKLYQSFICELDRQRFEVFLIFAPGGQRDGISRMLEKASDQVVALEGDLSNWHQQIAQLELDVLFYPDIGMTLDTYLLAMARLAPVQCVTYGHPDTTGIDTLDYYIGGDAPMEPEGAEAHYTEHLIRMPRLPFCYQFFTLPAPSEIPPRSTLGLPETGTLYSCPQTPFKFHPDFDAVLAAIAEGDPKGHIVLIDYGKLTERLKQRWAETAPILLERVCFVPEVPLELFLGLMVHFDVVLDPIHFGSGNSFFEAMAYGKPVVTWPGRFARARLV
ncbi:MAG: tetratricopeptide repeat protein, partial [Chitinophagales bacterium]|nr:tetratricopeptide repeat protein [Chitinophagales bacterium]